MKSSVEKLDGLKRKITVQVPSSNVISAFDKIYNDIRSKATIKGFRKGKAPLSVIRRSYAETASKDVVEKLIQEGFSFALKEHSLDPIGRPDIQFESLKEDQSFDFTAELEVRPEVQLNKYEGLDVVEEVLSVSEEETLKVLGNIQNQFSELVPVLEDRPAQMGDFVEFDFEGFVNDEPLEGGSAKAQQLELGTNSFIPGFEEGLVGMKATENKELNLNFPESYHEKDIAGKPVLFKVTLKSLLKKSLPDLDDEFAKKTGPYESLEALKEAVGKHLTESGNAKIQEQLKKDILDALVKENPVEVPQKLHTEQRNLMEQNLKRKFAQEGLPVEKFAQYKEKWNTNLDESASFMVQSSFLVQEIAKKHELYPSDKELNTFINDYLLKSHMNEEQSKEFYNNESHRSNMFHQMTEDKVVTYLIEKASIKKAPKKSDKSEEDKSKV